MSTPHRTPGRTPRPQAQSRTRGRGFTILELLIVIGILLAIGGLVLVNVLGAGERADKDLVRVQINGFEDALERFKYDMKRWPTEDEGLAALWDKEILEEEEDMSRWQGPYLSDPKPNDTWGNAWVYRFPGEIRGENYYDIISPGPDGEEDTEDDITNHDDLMNEDGEIDDAFEDFGESDGFDE